MKTALKVAGCVVLSVAGSLVATAVARQLAAGKSREVLRDALAGQHKLLRAFVEAGA